MTTFGILNVVLPSIEDFKELDWLDKIANIKVDDYDFSGLKKAHDTIRAETDPVSRRHEFNKALANEGLCVLKALQKQLESEAPNRQYILQCLKQEMKKKAEENVEVNELFESMFPFAEANDDKAVPRPARFVNKD